jgi:DNA (cytosine-5)-methyltransferase 1
MGFDSGDRRWRIPVSDTQAYRQFGNAVVPAVVAVVANSMKPFVVEAVASKTARKFAVNG